MFQTSSTIVLVLVLVIGNKSDDVMTSAYRTGTLRMLHITSGSILYQGLLVHS